MRHDDDRLPRGRRIAGLRPGPADPADYALALASFATAPSSRFNAQEFVTRIALLSPLSDWDLGFGVLMVLLTLEITRRTTGAGLTAVVLMFIAYNFFGHHLGGVLHHGPID